MKRLKDFIKDTDLDTFINNFEFSEEHLVNGLKLNIIIDEDLFDERNKKSGDRSGGVFSDTISIFIKTKDIEKPLIDEILTIDKNDYKVVEVKENMGMYEIELMLYDY